MLEQLDADEPSTFADAARRAEQLGEALAIAPASGLAPHPAEDEGRFLRSRALLTVPEDGRYRLRVTNLDSTTVVRLSAAGANLS